MRTLLAIAGTDPTSGAGVTADLAVFRDFGFHGLWVPTAVIDQDADRVHAVSPVPLDLFSNTLRRLIDWGRPAAIKIGVLYSADYVAAVVSALRRRPDGGPVVLDPVLLSGRGDRLSRDGLAEALVSQLLPMVTLATPNVPEAAELSGATITQLDEAAAAGEALREAGAEAVLVKGGHLAGAPGDVLCLLGGSHRLPSERPFLYDVHGTGCHLSSAAAALLARGIPVLDAVRAARRYLVGCVDQALPAPGRPESTRRIIVHGEITRRLAAGVAP